MLKDNFTLMANAYDYSNDFGEGCKETIGFSEWEVNVKLEAQQSRCIIADMVARGTDLTVIVNICRISEISPFVPVCYSVPEYHISGYTSATKRDTIHEITMQIAKVEENSEIDSYRTDAVSIGTVIECLEKEIILQSK